jgi:hypothetical protein
MNKKLIFVLAMLLPLSMVACKGKAKDYSFVDNFSFKEEIKGSERDELLQKINDKMADANKGTAFMVQESVGGSYKARSEMKQVATLHSNYYLSGESEMTVTRETGGVKTVTKEEGENHWFISSDNKYSFSFTIDKEGMHVEDLKYLADEAALKKEQKKISGLAGVEEMIKGTAYKDGKNYAFVFSDVTEQYLPVVFGNDTKVGHTRMEAQTVVKVNSKYQITKMLSYQGMFANYFDDTKEFLDDMQRVGYQYFETSISYGKRKVGNFAKYEEQLNKPVIGLLDYDLCQGSVDDEGVFTKGDPITYDVDTKIENLGKVHYSLQATFTATADKNAFVFGINATTYPDAQKDSEKKVTEDLVLPFEDSIGNVPGFSVNEKAKAAGKQVINVEPGTYTIRFDWDAEVGADVKVQLSNVSLIRSFPQSGI